MTEGIETTCIEVLYARMREARGDAEREDAAWSLLVDRIVELRRGAGHEDPTLLSDTSALTSALEHGRLFFEEIERVVGEQVPAFVCGVEPSFANDARHQGVRGLPMVLTHPPR